MRVAIAEVLRQAAKPWQHPFFHTADKIIAEIDALRDTVEKLKKTVGVDSPATMTITEEEKTILTDPKKLEKIPHRIEEITKDLQTISQ